LGIRHISDLNAYDHMLFILVLSVPFSLWHYKRVFWAVTGFTLGHSLSLALATFNLITVDSAVIEFLIPVTILISALFLAFKSQGKRLERFTAAQFVVVIFFGLIHGLGFSGYLRAMLVDDMSPFIPLLSFNLGVEAGQLIIVLIILLLNFLLEGIANIKKSYWALFCAGASTSLALKLIFENKIW